MGQGPGTGQIGFWRLLLGISERGWWWWGGAATRSLPNTVNYTVNYDAKSMSRSSRLDEVAVFLFQVFCKSKSNNHFSKHPFSIWLGLVPGCGGEFFLR